MNWNTYNNNASTAILQADRLRELLAELGCDIPRHAGDRILRGRCPVHGGREKNFQVDTLGDILPVRWACWSRQCHVKYKPSLLGLVRGVLSFQKGTDVNMWEAVNYLNRFLGDTPVDDRETTCRPKPKRQPKLFSVSREQVRQNLQIPSPYFLSREFSADVLDRLDVGHSLKQRKSIVPLHSDDGEKCIGYMARSELPACEKCGQCHPKGGECGYGEPKWTTGDGFPKGSHLYNYHFARRSSSPIVLLTEGSGDVWRAAEAGYLAVAMLGLSLSGDQIEKVAGLNKPVLLALDNDKPGREALSRLQDSLRNRVIHVGPLFIPPPYKDLGEMPAEEVRSWLSTCITPEYQS